MPVVADRTQVRRQVAGALPLALASVFVLATTALMPLLHLKLGRVGVAVAGVVGLLVAVVSLWLVWRGTLRRRITVRRAALRATVEMALYLSPVALLMVAFPIASMEIGSTPVGGVSLITVILASSVTVPWLSQAVCLPFYRSIGSIILDGDMDKIQARLCQVWPITFIQTLPAVAVFAVPVELMMRWSWTAFGTYVMLCVLHVVFVQSLVACNVGRRRVVWALTWACYAAALVLIPTAWYLPPIAGLVFQLIRMRRYLPQVRRPLVLGTIEVAGDLIRGLLLGAVLWSDKLFLFLKSHGLFQVNAIFFALLPAILAYNYYFVRLAPHIDRAVTTVRTAMEKRTSRILAKRSLAVADVVRTSITRTAFIGALMALVVTVIVSFYSPATLALVTAVSIASVLFMMTTLVCYKLDYIGYLKLAQGFSAVHLVFCAVAFVVLPTGAILYVWLIGIESVLLGGALYTCLDQWRSAEYALFWRHATAW